MGIISRGRSQETVNAPILHETPLFSALSTTQQERIAARLQPRSLAAGERLFSIGEEASSLHIIRTGWIRLATPGGDVLASLGPGSVFGETDLFRGQRRSSSAVAASAAELWTLDGRDLSDAIIEDPDLGIALSRAFGGHIVQMDAYLVSRLRQTPAWADARDEELAALARLLTPVEVARGQTLFRQGDPSQALYVIEAGEVVVSPQEDESAPSVRRAGQLLGELAMLTGKPHFYTAEAATDTLLWSLGRDDFDAVIHRHPSLAKLLSRGLRAPLNSEDQAAAAAVLARMPLFEGLDADVLVMITSRLLLLHMPAGEVIFAEGGRADAMYLVESGEVELVQGSGSRRELIARIGPGGFFGEMALLTGRPRSATAIASQAANLWVLYRNEFEALVMRTPAIAAAVSRGLSERLAEAGSAHTDRHLRHMRLLQGLPAAALREVADRLQPMRYRAEEVIFQQGDHAHFLYLIESGRIALLKEEEGVEAPVSILNGGEFVGEEAILTGGRYEATAQALTDVDVWLLRPADFEALAMRYPALALNLSRSLSERLRQTEAQTLHSMQASATSRRTVPVAVEAPPVAWEQATPAQVAPETPFAAVGPARGQERSVPEGSTATRAEPRASALDQLAAWFHSLSLAAKMRLAIVLVLLAWLLGVVAPSLLLNSVSFVNTAVNNLSAAFNLGTSEEGKEDGVRVLAMAVSQAQEPEPTATYTPLPTETPIPTDTPLPTETPTPTPEPTQTPLPTPLPTQAPPPVVVAAPTEAPAPQPEPRAVAASIAWDSRLDQLGVVLRPASVAPGQTYWRLIEARWANEEEAGGRHHIFVNVLDEAGNRVVGVPIKVLWRDGAVTGVTENKAPGDYSYNFQMYAPGNSYDLAIDDGTPSDYVAGMGLGDIERRAWKIHVAYYLTFQRTTR